MTKWYKREWLRVFLQDIGYFFIIQAAFEFYLMWIHSPVPTLGPFWDSVSIIVGIIIAYVFRK